MKKGISTLLLIVLMLNLIFQTVGAREIAPPETRVDSPIVDAEGSVVDGSSPSVQYGVGQRVYYRDFDKKSGMDIRNPNASWASSYPYDKASIDENIIVERIYDEANEEGYYEEGQLYRKYRITYFPMTGIRYKQYKTDGDIYPYENLNMGFALTKDLEVAYMDTRVEFNGPGDNTIKTYVDTPASLKVDYNISPHGLHHGEPSAAYPGSANLRYITGYLNMSRYFFNYSGVNDMPLRMQMLPSTEDPNNTKAWFTSNYWAYDTYDLDIIEGGEFSRTDFTSAIKWQTGRNINDTRYFLAKYVVDLVVKVNDPEEVTNKFSGILAGYSSWQNSWLVAGGQMNGFKKENRNAETIKIVYREHFNGEGGGTVKRRPVRFNRSPILANELTSRNLVVLEKVENMPEKGYTENTFAITTGTDGSGGIDIETYKNSLEFIPSIVSGYKMRSFGDDLYKMTGTVNPDGTKTINVDVYYDKDIIGADKGDGTYEEKPSEDYVTVQYLDGDHGTINPGQMTRYYVRAEAGKRLSDLDDPDVTPDADYIFSHWSMEGETDPVDMNTRIDRDMNLVANYFPVISREEPPTPIADRYVKVIFNSKEQGRFGNDTNPEVKSVPVWVLQEAGKNIGDVRRAVSIDSLLVVTDSRYRHTGWTVPDATVVADNMEVDATYELKKVTIPVKKTWTHTSENEQLPQSIELSLYRKCTDQEACQKELLKKITLRPDSNGTWQGSFADIPMQDEYILEEDAITGYEMSWTNTGTAEAPSFSVVNRKLPSLSIQKKLPGLFADHSKEFTIKVSLSKAGKAISGSYAYQKGEEKGNITFSAAGEATVSLKHNEEIKILYLPVDTDYVVEEDAASAQGYTVSYKDNQGRLSDDVKVEVTNTGREIVPTGIARSATGPLAMAGAAILALALVIGFVKLKERNKLR